MASIPDGSTDAVPGTPLDDAADAGPVFVVDITEPPWSLEHRTLDHGIGECGGMESTEFPRLRFESDAGPLLHELPTVDYFCPHGMSRTIAVSKSFDYDGDGFPELLVVTQTAGATGITGEDSTIWTVRGPDIHPFHEDAGPLPPFAGVEDVDNDGRPDLLSRGAFAEVAGSSSCGTGFVVTPIFAYHSLAAGGFSSRDAVARRFLDDTCGADSLEAELSSTTDPGHDLGTAIACARAHGRSAEAVKRALDAACASFSESSCDGSHNDAGKLLECPSWALDLAKAEPSR
jgi:hypothetical protein